MLQWQMMCDQEIEALWKRQMLQRKMVHDQEIECLSKRQMSRDRDVEVAKC